jgi:hypothetical protein
MVVLEWEIRTTWRYVNAWIKPAMKVLGIPFTAISRKRYATHDFFGGAGRVTPLLPAFTDQSGAPAKLNEWCSGEWKRDVCLRWAAEQPGWKDRGVDNWVGISFEERRRVRAPRREWLKPVYPLVHVRPTGLDGCLAAVARAGWPEPPRSRCRNCPNQSDAEWSELTPQEWDMACDLEDELRLTDPNIYFHKSLIPLRQVVLKPEREGGLFGGCHAGMCF